MSASYILIWVLYGRSRPLDNDSRPKEDNEMAGAAKSKHLLFSLRFAPLHQPKARRSTDQRGDHLRTIKDQNQGLRFRKHIHDCLFFARTAATRLCLTMKSHYKPSESRNVIASGSPVKKNVRNGIFPASFQRHDLLAGNLISLPCNKVGDTHEGTSVTLASDPVI